MIIQKDIVRASSISIQTLASFVPVAPQTNELSTSKPEYLPGPDDTEIPENDTASSSKGIIETASDVF